jgi:hypothetical protein
LLQLGNRVLWQRGGIYLEQALFLNLPLVALKLTC